MAAAFVLGLVAGLRTLLAPAALLLVRGGSAAGYVLGVVEVGELALDLHPAAQSRTRPVALMGRVVSGAITGWLLCGFRGQSPIAGAAAGVAGALIGAFGGKAVRLVLIERIGRVPAALAEDAVAIALVVVALLAAPPR
ncbi:MAG TPA: hypothetical protein VHT05_09595 [Candidatus Elarobacter sp.]|nr:hypothetical protein [Candidatus Elarobacter sp.]